MLHVMTLYNGKTLLTIAVVEMMDSVCRGSFLIHVVVAQQEGAVVGLRNFDIEVRVLHFVFSDPEPSLFSTVIFMYVKCMFYSSWVHFRRAVFLNCVSQLLT